MRISRRVAAPLLAVIAALTPAAPQQAAAAPLSPAVHQVINPPPQLKIPKLVVEPDEKVEQGGNTYFRFWGQNGGNGPASSVTVLKVAIHYKKNSQNVFDHNVVTTLSYATLTPGEKKPITIQCVPTPTTYCRSGTVNVELASVELNYQNNSWTLW